MDKFVGTLWECNSNQETTDVEIQEWDVVESNKAYKVDYSGMMLPFWPDIDFLNIANFALRIGRFVPS